MLWIVTSFQDYSSSDKDWAWWLCENDDFSVTVAWKKKSKYNRKPLRMATSLGRPFFWRTVHTFTLVSTSLQWPATFFFPQGGCCGEFHLYWLPTGVKPMTFWFIVTGPDALPPSYNRLMRSKASKHCRFIPHSSPSAMWHVCHANPA